MKNYLRKNSMLRSLIMGAGITTAVSSCDPQYSESISTQRQDTGRTNNAVEELATDQDSRDEQLGSILPFYKPVSAGQILEFGKRIKSEGDLGGAINYFVTSAELYKDNGNYLGAAYARILMADVLASLAETQEQYDGSIRNISKAQNALDSSGYDSSLVNPVIRHLDMIRSNYEQESALPDKHLLMGRLEEAKNSIESLILNPDGSKNDEENIDDLIGHRTIIEKTK